tara:strand:+ start:1486 stop:2427 length:942 start_codon:yes stop_codon:yes gene_type:complete
MKNKYQTISVIICTYNRKKWVEKLLVSISEQTKKPKEILIIDASIDVIDYAIPKTIDVNIIKSNKIQLTYQRNIGVGISSGDIILHLDDDTYLKPDFFDSIYRFFNDNNNKNIGAISGYVKNQWGLKKYNPDKFMRFIKWLGIYDGDFSPGSVSPSGLFIELGSLEPQIGFYKTDFISGCSFAVRREVYDEYKHPEHINKYGGEDKAFSRMIAPNWEMGICFDASLDHYSAPGGARQTNYSETKSTVKIHMIIQNMYGIKGSSTLRLRLYYVLIALKLYIISVLMFISIYKIKKSFRWFMRASGYLVGAIAPV